MAATPHNTPAERPRIRATVLWVTFAALLVLGVVLYFRFAARILPLLEGVGDR